MMKFLKEKFRKNQKLRCTIYVFDLEKDVVLREMYAKYISLKYKTKVYQEINEKFFILSVETTEMWKKITDRECFSIWKENQPR